MPVLYHRTVVFLHGYAVQKQQWRELKQHYGPSAARITCAKRFTEIVQTDATVFFRLNLRSVADARFLGLTSHAKIRAWLLVTRR